MKGMDYGFKDRVDKVFGSISSSSWSLTDAPPVERREWNRPDRDDDQIPVSSSFQADNGSDWDIRSSIGLDSTLDNEEEEDAYDKMAEGRENCGHRLYMKDVTDHGPFLNSHNVLPRANSLKDDHDDAVAAQGSDEPTQAAASEDGDDDDGIVTIKSILKRKTYHEASKPAKHVRFDSTCKNVDAAHPDPTHVPENGHGVPDYILNPSKYTRYTFDNSSPDGSNSESLYLDLLKKSSKHGGVEHNSCDDELPKSVVFIPRKKRGEEQVKQTSTQACSTIGIAAVEVQHTSEMQEDDDDDVCTKARCQKPVRQYRSKMEEYDDVS